MAVSKAIGQSVGIIKAKLLHNLPILSVQPESVTNDQSSMEFKSIVDAHY